MARPRIAMQVLVVKLQGFTLQGVDIEDRHDERHDDLDLFVGVPVECIVVIGITQMSVTGNSL